MATSTSKTLSNICLRLTPPRCKGLTMTAATCSRTPLLALATNLWHAFSKVSGRDRHGEAKHSESAKSDIDFAMTTAVAAPNHEGGSSPFQVAPEQLYRH